MKNKESSRKSSANSDLSVSDSLQYNTKVTNTQAPFVVLMVVASNAQVYILCRLLVAEGPQAPPEGRQRERSAQVIPGRSRFGFILLVDHRLSGLCHSATNKPSANVYLGGEATLYTIHLRSGFWKPTPNRTAFPTSNGTRTTDYPGQISKDPASSPCLPTWKRGLWEQS